MSTTPTNGRFTEVLDALRDVHDEASLWRLSDELVKIAPSGVQSVQDVVDAATAKGIPTKSVNTLRLYRDVAIRFPASERVEGVSFSAHREAIAVGDMVLAKQTLIDLAKQHGAANVTVTTVKRAIAAATGKPAPQTRAQKAATAVTYIDVAVDLSTANGSKFLSELPAMLGHGKVTLDGLHSGLTHVLAKVEGERAKAARKAAATAAKVSKAAPSSAVEAAKARRQGKAAPAPAPKAATASAPRKSGKAGDLRGL